MSALIRAELRKVRSTRVLWVAIAAAVAVTGLTLGLQMVNAGRAGTPSFRTAQGAVNVLGAGGRAALVALVVGIVIVTAEFRHGTIVTTLLVAPSRRDVVVAKLAAAAVVGALIAVVVTVLCAGVGLVTGALSVASDNAAVVRTVAGVTLTIPLYAVLGAGFGALVRNQTVAVAAALLWLVAGEALIGSYGLVWLEPWTPTGATRAIAQDPALPGALPVWGGVLLLLGYGLAFAGLGGWQVVREDVG